jgi:hypothetical protein
MFYPVNEFDPFRLCHTKQDLKISNKWYMYELANCKMLRMLTFTTNAGPRVPSGGVTLKRRCTYRPSVICLIVNKLLSLSLSLSHTHNFVKSSWKQSVSPPARILLYTHSLTFLDSHKLTHVSGFSYVLRAPSTDPPPPGGVSMEMRGFCLGCCTNLGEREIERERDAHTQKSSDVWSVLPYAPPVCVCRRVCGCRLVFIFCFCRNK